MRYNLSKMQKANYPKVTDNIKEYYLLLKKPHTYIGIMVQGK